jgi:glycosyltransferase involved in cell wall biosynthesis
MEAMACGCCVAATRVGGNPELITHGETGMLFEPRDVAGLAEVLGWLVRDPARRGALGFKATRLMRSRFSLEAAALRMGGIYSEVLAC